MRNRKGNAAIEFALGAGVLVATFVGTFQYGYTFLQYNRLQMAVAQGARYASMAPYDSATTTPSSTFLSSVRNMVVYGNPTSGTYAVLPGLTPSNITLTVNFANGVPSAITLGVTGYTINGLFGTFTLTGKPQFTYPYVGIWTPL